jgi:hypothetical protein
VWADDADARSKYFEPVASVWRQAAAPLEMKTAHHNYDRPVLRGHWKFHSNGKES